MSALVSTRLVNSQFQVAPFGTKLTAADEADAAQLWNTVYGSICDSSSRVSPFVKGLSPLESCGELAATVDIKSRWTYIDSGGQKAMRDGIDVSSQTERHKSGTLRPSERMAILPIGIEKNAHIGSAADVIFSSQKWLIFVKRHRRRRALNGTRERQRAPGATDPGSTLNLGGCRLERLLNKLKFRWRGPLQLAS